MGPYQDKAIGDSFPMDQNSKTRIVQQLREKAGPRESNSNYHKGTTQ